MAHQIRSCWRRSGTPPRSLTSASCGGSARVRLLCDANLAPAIAARLHDAGHDSAHVIDVGLAEATDPEIVDYADARDCVIVTADTDFPMLMALRRSTSPSVVLLRGINELVPDRHAALLIANLPVVAHDLGRGAIVSLGLDHRRVRSLPLA